MIKNQDSDNILIQRYGNLADGIVLLFSGYVEVVIHDLRTQTVVYIANNISKRNLGDDAALDEVEFDENENVIGPYEKLNWDGLNIRSTSIVLRDDDNQQIGMLCINMNIASFEAAKALLDTFLSGAQLVPQPDKLFHDDWQERINSFIHHWLNENRLNMNSLSHKHKRALVEALYDEGAFEGKSTQNYVASVLNMGRATVFKYLREIKQNK
ncbi:helix-turn-helix transcriptional regulator [Marinomonas sp. PE14-40]|uniref:helix-turn-helix transcriptional regulator n=1 Tax=Marinomonas sp. PE14-40 TaxID=3060621 RepID=UPI003F6767BF